MFQNYNIRAEFPDNEYKDFTVGAENLEDARMAAEEKLPQFSYFPVEPHIEWHGLVMFVGRSA